MAPGSGARAQACAAQPKADAQPGPELDPYRPLTKRRTALVVVLALGTVVLIALAMLQPHQRLMAAKAARAQAAALAACPPGAASAAPGCPGSRMQILLLPVQSLPPTPGPGG